MDISGNFEKLRQLILLEEFKNCMSTDVRTYLCEKSITDLGLAAIAADEYLLTHKSFGKSHNVPRLNMPNMTSLLATSKYQMLKLNWLKPIHQVDLMVSQIIV